MLHFSLAGKLHLVVFKGSTATKCDLLLGAPGGARYIMHGKPGAISGTKAIHRFGPAAKSQNTSYFVLSEVTLTSSLCHRALTVCDCPTAMTA